MNSVAAAVQLLGKGYYYGAGSFEYAENEADLALAWLAIAEQAPKQISEPSYAELYDQTKKELLPRIQEPSYEELRDELAKATAEIRRLRDLDDPDYTADDYLCKTCGESLEFACESCGAPGPDVIHELRRRLRDAKEVARDALDFVSNKNAYLGLERRLDAIK